jgi:hypothetical protein
VFDSLFGRLIATGQWNLYRPSGLVAQSRKVFIPTKLWGIRLDDAVQNFILA